MIQHGEDSSSNKAVKAYTKEFMKLMKTEGCITQQVFSFRDFIRQDAKQNLCHTRGKSTARAQAHEGEIDPSCLSKHMCQSEH